jgi:Helix-turn-helix domain
MERAELKGYLEEGMSFEAIGRLMGRDPSTVAYWARKHGLQSAHAQRHAARGAIERVRLEILITQGLSIRAIADAVDRSPTTVRYWLRVYGLKLARRHQLLVASTEGPTRILRQCARHGVTEFVRTGTAGRFRCRRCRAAYRAERRRRVKRKLVEEGGGCCSICGYAGAPGAIHFHHIDPAKKAFNLAAQGVGRSLDAARAEAAKCILVCANCHAEIESTPANQPTSRASSAVIRRRRRVKATLVAEAGGACDRCGYDRSLAALHFHHDDPTTKAFGLSESGITRSLARARDEARKCTLLCANCHAEVEALGANLPAVHWPSSMHHNPG